MIRVEGKNTRLRHYLARLKRKSFYYSKSEEMLRYSIQLLIHYLKVADVPVPYQNQRNHFRLSAIALEVYHTLIQQRLIMITYRIAHALRADKIFVLENGSILASSSHRDLLPPKGIYTTLRNKLMGEIPTLWELSVFREAVKSKYNKLLRSLTATHGS